jgi:hypothetical protein
MGWAVRGDRRLVAGYGANSLAGHGGPVLIDGESREASPPPRLFHFLLFPLPKPARRPLQEP